MNCPSISIIIPTYNVAPYIRKCLESIAAQIYKGPIECLIIDDCGTDNSILIAEEFIKDYNSINHKSSTINFKIIHREKNGGLSAARNTGIREAKGDYIAFLDSDDFVTPDAYSKLLDAFGNEKDLAFTEGLIYKYENGQASVFVKDWDTKQAIYIEPQEFCINKILQKTSHPAWNKLFRSDVIKEIMFREGKKNEDTLYMYDLSKVIEGRGLVCKVIPEYIYYYRMRDDGICRSDPRLFDRDIFENLLTISIECKDSHPELSEKLYSMYVCMLFEFLNATISVKKLDLHYTYAKEKYQRVPFTRICRSFNKQQSGRALFAWFAPELWKAWLRFRIKS